ncbi:glutathionylspermidine synthase family protein [Albimonas sp. CAU 1670]|uniref:glutathionylspermidine synthase family protein n=1 Tax=Albimonas sp. CAU 1670 TaxID=3032599 RepID=UPI0023D98A9B|nr:glutathionylspermidine synthase family protein [Albimonas sp. CAU 1670]MDF2230939.1 glutathionylspermidine synthase family protein [Albimonas sp. CAU 1670]
MQRIQLAPRADWRRKAEALGFTFHTMHGQAYWDESSAYAFTLRQIEDDLEDPATALHAMCLEAVAQVAGSQELMERLGIPDAHRDLVAESWRAREPSLYGRFDLVYDGTGPAKLLEYNADTPTSVYEAGSFQWLWLEDMQDSGGLPCAEPDQFNLLHDKLVERFAEILPPGEPVHFASVRGHEEDFATVEYLAWIAKEAGLVPHYVPLDAIGLTETGQFADDEARVIGTLFKLYPWEDLLLDDFAGHIAGAHCRFIEPAWKALLSNKGILPVLWRLFEGHPNLLPAFFADEMQGGDPAFERAREALERGHVVKPIFSREGASIEIVERGATTERSVNRDYDRHPVVVQAYAPLPVFDGARPVLGAWIVGETCVGLGVREDDGRITQDLSRFKPHFIMG